MTSISEIIILDWFFLLLFLFYIRAVLKIEILFYSITIKYIQEYQVSMSDYSESSGLIASTSTLEMYGPHAEAKDLIKKVQY